VAEAGRPWEPSIGERVLLVATGETGAIVQLALTEWGLLCDVQFDLPSGGPGRPPARRVHASTELRPLGG
jgi:hypothetical protein